MKKMLFSSRIVLCCVHNAVYSYACQDQGAFCSPIYKLDRDIDREKDRLSPSYFSIFNVYYFSVGFDEQLCGWQVLPGPLLLLCCVYTAN